MKIPKKNKIGEMPKYYRKTPKKTNRNERKSKTRNR